MKLRFLSVALASVFAAVHAHDDHDHSMQMPLDYVKYPYQAMYYPGDNGGSSDTAYTMHLVLIFSSHGGLYIFWHHHIRQATMGAMSGQRQDGPL